METQSGSDCSNLTTHGGSKPTVSRSSVPVRIGFLRKVFGLLGIKLLFTTSVGAAFLTFEPLKYYFANIWMMALLGTLSIVLEVKLASVQTQFPLNMYLTAGFAGCESTLIGIVATYYDVGLVTQGCGLSFAVIVALTLFTCQTSRTFTVWGASLFSILWIFGIVFVMQLFSYGVPFFPSMLSAIGGILFSVYVIRDTRKIMTKYSADEYIDAFVCICLDIVNIIPDQTSSAASFVALAYFQSTSGLAQNWL